MSKSLQALDLRTQSMMVALKGQIAGSVRQVTLQASGALLCSVSLDRWVRIHNARTRALLGRIYLKSQLTACCWGPENRNAVDAHEPPPNESKRRRGRRLSPRTRMVY
jgi:hypothetical protein